MKKGFTVVELIIVVIIVLTLAAAAISQTGGVTNALRLNNAFEQTVFFTQRARTMAVTQAESAPRFGIDLSVNDLVILFAGDASDMRDRYDFPQNIYLDVRRGGASGSDCGGAQITFDRETGDANFSCGGALLEGSGQEDTVLFIRMCQTVSGTGNDCVLAEVERERSFTIHRASGIPQF